MNNTYYSDIHQHSTMMDGSQKEGNDPNRPNVFYSNIYAKQNINNEGPFGGIYTNLNESDTPLNVPFINEIQDSNTTNFVSSNKTTETVDTSATTYANETQQYDSNYYTVKTNYDETRFQMPSNDPSYSNVYNVYVSNIPSPSSEYYQPQSIGNSPRNMGYYNEMYQTMMPTYVGMPMSLPASPYMSCALSPTQSAVDDSEIDNFMLTHHMPQLSTPTSPCFAPVYNGYGQFLGDSMPQFTLTQSAMSTGMNYPMAMAANGRYEEIDPSFYAIVDEIVENTKYLPPKNSEVKCSLDVNHPIHCVWKDMNRGHFSWRCRWWENGKRLSKNFNIKRYGDIEAMRMAIIMKLKNSTPSERLQLLKEQREVVRVTMEKGNNAPLDLSSSAGHFNSPNHTIHPPSPALSEYSGEEAYSVTIQDANFDRLSWAYTMLNRHPNGKDSNLKCKICSKTIKTARGSNIEQSFFLHLFRMHKNPWKQYVDIRGLDSAPREMLDNLYSFHGINDRTPWKVNSSLCRP